MSAFQYWRWVIPENHGGLRTTMSEVTGRIVPAGSDVLSAGTASASGVDGSNVAANAIDGTTTTRWQSGAETTPWWKIDLGSGNGEILVEYSISSGTAGTANNSPKEWTVEYSHDNISWIVLKSVVNEPAWGNEETRDYTLPFVYIPWKTPHTQKIFLPQRVNGNAGIRRMGL